METAATTITQAAEQTTKGGSLNITGLIVLILMLVICGVGYYFYKRAAKKGKDGEADNEKTAQELINVFDLGEDCLYTIDGMCFMYIKIDGIPLEMFEQKKLFNSSKVFASGLVAVRFPWKFVSVSRPMDIKETLQYYTDLQETASAGHKALLQQEINELVAMTSRGETLERQHYAVLWDKDDKDGNLQLRKNAEKLVKIFTENKLHCELLRKEGIFGLLNCINNPSYSHIETSYDLSDNLLSAIIK